MNNTANPMNSTQNPAPLAPLTEGESVDIAQYWRVVKRHKLGIFSTTVIFVVIGVLIALGTTPVYRTSTKLIVDPLQPNVNAPNQRANTALIYLFYETQYEIIGSLNIAKKAVDKVDLIERFKAEQAAEETEKEGALGFLQKVTSLLSANGKQGTMSESDDEVLRTLLAREIQEVLSIDGGQKSQIIRIGYENTDAQLAVDITNAIAEAYMEFGLEARLSGAKQTSSWLDDQLQDLKNKLKESEKALQKFQKSRGMIDSAQQESLAGTRLSTLTEELIRAQAKRSEVEIRRDQVNSKRKRGNYSALSSILGNKEVQALEREATKLSRSVQDLSERYGEKHPKMIAARADLKEAKRNLETEINKAVSAVRKEFQAALDHERKLKSMIRKEKKGLTTIKDSSFELARLEREVTNNQKLYDSFLVRYQEANISEQYDASSVHVIDTAQLPDFPFKPKKKLLVIIAIVLGLLVGLLLAFLREHMDNTFKTTSDLEEKLKLPTLGITSATKSGKNDTSPQFQVIENPRSPFAENVSNIRTGLLFSNIDNPPQTILVTSAIAGEGKSTLAVNLAASLSQLGDTLLLEVDLRKPSVARYLDIEPTPGVADHALHKEPILKEAATLIGDENSKLYAMPAGSFTPNPLELLSSDYFRERLEELKRTFTHIVLDSPPVLAVSDAAVIGHLVDSVIVAAKAESTKIPMTQECIDRLRKANVHVTGTVLTQANAKSMGYYGDHYYDASYYGDCEADAAKS